MPNIKCSKCRKVLEEIGVPPQIQMMQMYKQVVNIGSEQVPEEIKNDPFLYRGFFCTACNKVFCPHCSNMQREVCPVCGQRRLMPAYRPLLKNVKAVSATRMSLIIAFLGWYVLFLFVLSATMVILEDYLGLSVAKIPNAFLRVTVVSLVWFVPAIASFFLVKRR